MEEINVFWFKRDLRLHDNPSLSLALKSNLPLALVYIHEPSLQADPNYSPRHFQFIGESLVDLQNELKNQKIELLIFKGEVIEVLDQLQQSYRIKRLYSHLEVGIGLTFQRDLNVKKWCKINDVVWHEKAQNAVVRGLRNRITWREDMQAFMTATLATFAPDRSTFITSKRLHKSLITDPFNQAPITEHGFQKGGRRAGLKYCASFFADRVKNYSSHLSKPELSRRGCSRLSPYFAWGCLSTREIYQKTLLEYDGSPWKMQLKSFSSRLVWQSHFIQKFESETRMENQPLNRVYFDLDKEVNDTFIEAWKKGQTGYPLIDAAMRCVVQTGFLNFRLRSMIVSFLTHHLYQPFTAGSQWLARQFLDFEPGIHYAQFQMQAGLTGINIVRVYNPTGNAIDHDPEATFIKKYVPELAALPSVFAIEPWKLTEMEALMYNFDYGKDYPKRIVDISDTRKKALDTLYALRETETGKKEIARILNKHTLHASGNRIP